MIKLMDILNEVPIGSYSTIGDFDKPHSFKDPRDRAAITNSGTVEKVKNMFKNTSVDFDFYFVNKLGLRKFSERGKVSLDFIYDPKGLGLNREYLKINGDNITVFFVGNTAADKMPMTAWTIAHRVGHVMNRTPQFQDFTKYMDGEFDQLLALYGKHKSKEFGWDKSDYKKIRAYELAKGRLFNHIGTMRSAREGRIHRRAYEFYYELFVQYLKDGKITFNPLTKNILIGFGPYGSKSIASTQDLDMAQDKLDMIANTIPYHVEDVLGANVGDIFVM